MTILADTSAWVDALRGHRSRIEQTLNDRHELAYTEPILMEVLMGARTEDEWWRLRRFLTGAALLAFDSVADFEGAARINREGRRNGITLGKFDCLILAVARRTGAVLLTRDRRQANVGRLLGVEVVYADSAGAM